MSHMPTKKKHKHKRKRESTANGGLPESTGDTTTDGTSHEKPVKHKKTGKNPEESNKDKDKKKRNKKKKRKGKEKDEDPPS
ncbi:mediator of RNA polymerase II transcription subunit 19-like isoform X2 [Dreissena polymorpha]|uniref:Uncharacterized protein n=2 Tax=Dreissena polymorpha TaxID=45954 RepID=A0A9D4RXX9_DREPO|nr:mediator of RNA polymerase II transcription subunit 19-like isoform X2 [Dreissena polymorpha]KAH3883080.1 hypothetical protein DPMN_007028 [Dreissena polymorpha]